MLTARLQDCLPSFKNNESEALPVPHVRDRRTGTPADNYRDVARPSMQRFKQLMYLQKGLALVSSRM